MAVVDVVELPLGRRSVRAAVDAARLRQWTKNALIFAGIVFAARIGDWQRWSEAVAAFLAYCAASSAAYLVNDVRDTELDRLHPVKRHRPIASGDLSERAALGVAIVLAAFAVAVASLLGTRSLALVLAFLSLQAAYSLGLKHVLLLDVAAIAGLFVIRAAAGAVAVRVHISVWLLVCTALLALFLALAKRRAELVLVAEKATPGRPVLHGYSRYSQGLLDRLVVVLAAATVVVYALYTAVSGNSRLLVLTVPLVAFGIGRYVLLVRSHGAGEEPEEILLQDLPLLGAIGLWVVACAAILLAA